MPKRRLTCENLEDRCLLTAAPELLVDLRAGSESSLPSPPVAMGGWAYFAANDGVHGTELWRTDGTAAGTQLFKDIRPGSTGSHVSHLVASGDRLYFRADDGANGTELWTSNGTAEGTSLVKDLVSGMGGSYPTDLIFAGDTLYFTALNEPSGPTQQFGPLPYLSAADSPFDQSQVGADFWLEDFEDGLLNVPGVAANGGSVRSPSSLSDSVDADDGAIDGNGDEGHSYLVRPGASGVTFLFDRDALGGLPSSVGIVVTDGSLGLPAATVEFFDASGAVLLSVNDFAKVPEKTTADDRFVGIQHAGGIVGVRVTSLGTGNNGLEVDHLQYGQIVSPATTGLKLWATDGSPAGIRLIQDLGIQTAFAAATVGDTLYFTGSDSSQGVELWSAASGSVSLVKDIRAGSEGSLPQSLTNASGTLYFTADDGVGGRELWKTDGTAVGTVLVKDVRTGSAGSAIEHLVNVGGTLFFSATGGGFGNELWKSDGTEAGTVLVKDVRAGSGSSNPAELTVVSGTLFFVADASGSLFELWKTDGSLAGTVLVKDIFPGATSANPAQLTNAGGALLFSADDGTAGRELWVSHGTGASTQRIADIAPGGSSSAPRNIIVVANRIVFSADDGVHGHELWSVDLIPPPPWHNRNVAEDVNGDHFIAPDDALAVINDLNRFGSRPVPPGVEPNGFYLNVDADGHISPNDALAVINYINANRPALLLLASGAEGESYEASLGGQNSEHVPPDSAELALLASCLLANENSYGDRLASRRRR